ncbi:MAG: carbonic anhydrase [Desulfobacterium sp.]|nr:carbonic anhydrase [Desulfobacterium sp.]MBU3948518.1 carbonic anhydrase [Pseudomonadota bacterium]MBU4037834.1 carbonic anhydrase [Pseudomonadota bacterium]
MKRTSMLVVGFMILVLFSTAALAMQTDTAVTGKEAQQKLLDGNKRYVNEKQTHINQTAKRRIEVAKGQHPFAVVVCCSDSRVPPEILFDQGLGDLFVIRLAGNILNDEAIGSIEYAVDHLDVQYIMVLGHERCGAVGATVQGGEAPGHIGSLVKAIQPAVDKAKSQPGDVLDNAVRANVGMVVEQLKSSAPILNEFIKKGVLTVVGARYDLDDGAVAILP